MKTELKSKEEILFELTKYHDGILWSKALEAMQIFSDQNTDAVQDLFTKPSEVLNPLEYLYRKELNKKGFFIPDRNGFYKWIVEKIMGEPSGEDIREPIQNALCATERFSIQDCDDITDGILDYIKDYGYKIVKF